MDRKQRKKVDIPITTKNVLSKTYSLDPEPLASVCWTNLDQQANLKEIERQFNKFLPQK